MAKYYTEEQEQAVIRYQQATDKREKDLIYSTYLYKPIYKLVESVIRTYKLWEPNVSEEDQIHDAHGFLVQQIHKFDSSTGKKSFSYFGTVIKHYLINLRIRKVKKDFLADDVYELSKEDLAHEHLTYRQHGEDKDYDEDYRLRLHEVIGKLTPAEQKFLKVYQEMVVKDLHKGPTMTKRYSRLLTKMRAIGRGTHPIPKLNQDYYELSDSKIDELLENSEKRYYPNNHPLRPVIVTFPNGEEKEFVRLQELCTELSLKYHTVQSKLRRGKGHMEIEDHKIRFKA